MRLALIRHMPTAWNAAGRLQGRADTASGAAADWRLPAELAGYRWLTSPLARCTETARRLGVEAAPSTPQELAGRIVADLKKWREVIVSAGIKAQ